MVDCVCSLATFNVTTLSQVADSQGKNKKRDVTDGGRSEWWCVGPGSGRSPCQLSMPLVSRSWSLQRLDEISDKVPIQPCPGHGLPLAQTALPVSFPLSVWPVIPDCLDTSQHAIPHPSQPGLFSAPLLSLCSNTASQHWLAGGLWRATEEDRTIPGSSLSYSHSSHLLEGLRKMLLSNSLQSSCKRNWNDRNPRLELIRQSRGLTVSANNWNEAACTNHSMMWTHPWKTKTTIESTFCMLRDKWMRTMSEPRGNYRADVFGYRLICSWQWNHLSACVLKLRLSVKNTCERSSRVLV